jgi:hypothetical protein
MKVYILMGLEDPFDVEMTAKVYAATLNPEIAEKLLQDHIHDYGRHGGMNVVTHGFWLVEQELVEV